MAGSYKYILIAGAVVGIAGGTIAALAISGNETKASTSQTDSSAQTRTPEPPKPSSDDANAAKAEAANDAGKEKLYGGDFKGASELFREAVARAAEPKYFLNLGSSLFQEGKFDESLFALNALLNLKPTDKVKRNAVLIAKTVVAECDKQHMECHPPPALKTLIEQPD